jgi:hypothetical protein
MLFIMYIVCNVQKLVSLLCLPLAGPTGELFPSLEVNEKRLTKPIVICQKAVNIFAGPGLTLVSTTPP